MIRCIFLCLCVFALTSCATKYHSTQISLSPEYVSKRTIRWCVKNECPDFVQMDLAECQATARKLDFRNTLDDPTAMEDFSGWLVSKASSAWEWAVE